MHLLFYFYIAVLRIGAKTLCSLVSDFPIKPNSSDLEFVGNTIADKKPITACVHGNNQLNFLFS